MAELVYPPIVRFAKGVFAALRVRPDLRGEENIPRTGGAVIAINHVGYLDFALAGYAAQPQGRLVRFMAKQEVFRHKVAGPLMRGMRHIPVDRSAGASSYLAAVQALRDGELVGVFPEATISRSFTLKEFKSGAARMAAEAGVPLVPLVVWGSQRLVTKGRKPEWRRRTRVVLNVGEPLHPQPGDDPVAVTAELKARMQLLLEEAVRDYDDGPVAGEDLYWLPSHLGGTAPTPEQAAALDAEEKAARAAARAARAAGDTA